MMLLLRIGSAQFAYTSAGGFLRALGQAWEEGLDAIPLMSRTDPILAGADVRAVDLDLRAAFAPEPA